MQSSSYSYRSSDSVFSNTTSTRTSLDSNENLLSVHCGPTLVNSCISFSNESLDGHRYEVFCMRLSSLPCLGLFFPGPVSSLTSERRFFFPNLLSLSGWICCSRLLPEFRGIASAVRTNSCSPEMLSSL